MSVIRVSTAVVFHQGIKASSVSVIRVSTAVVFHQGIKGSSVFVIMVPWEVVCLSSGCLEQ